MSDLARERGCSPLDLMCELAVEEDLTTRFRAYIANDDVGAVGRLLTHDHVVLGLSDAGAHIDQLCDAPLPTDLLGTWVRDRKVMPLEHAVRKLTGEPADMFGFVRRGYLREGYCGRRVRVRPDDGGHRSRRGASATSRPTQSDSPPRSPPGSGTCWSTARRSAIDEAQLDSAGLRPGTHPEIA